MHIFVLLAMHIDETIDYIYIYIYIYIFFFLGGGGGGGGLCILK